MPEFTEYAPGTPCWVDVTSPELDRTISFYSELFGWEADQDPRPRGGRLHDVHEGRASRSPAGSPPQQEGMPSHWTTYLASDDVDATAGKVREAGGTVLMDPFDVFDSGRMTVAQDPTGAVFGIWQAGEHPGAQLANEPGSVTWNECQTLRRRDRRRRSTEPSSATRSRRCRWGTGTTYHVLKVGRAERRRDARAHPGDGRGSAELGDRVRRRGHRRDL